MLPTCDNWVYTLHGHRHTKLWSAFCSIFWIFWDFWEFAREDTFFLTLNAPLLKKLKTNRAAPTWWRKAPINWQGQKRIMPPKHHIHLTPAMTRSEWPREDDAPSCCLQHSSCLYEFLCQCLCVCMCGCACGQMLSDIHTPAWPKFPLNLAHLCTTLPSHWLY